MIRIVCNATLRGVLEYFEPNKIWTWEELDAFTGKEPDKWTWQYRSLINMAERGYDVIEINTENTKAYLENGIYETMVKDLGQEAADIQRKNADLDSVKDDLVKFALLCVQGKACSYIKNTDRKGYKTFS